MNWLMLQKLEHREAMVALHAGVPLVPAFYQGPNDVRIAHFVQRPRVRVTFGTPIPTAGLPLGKQTTMALTRQLQAAIGELRLIATAERSDA
jgi:1-acyl-sn-glycerol-3-phosphate acyltransferase